MSLNGTMPLAARAAPRPRLHTDARRSWLPATGVPRRPLPRTPGADLGARGVWAHHGKGPCGTVRRWRPYPASTAVSCAPRWRHAPRLGSRARWSASGRCRKRSQRHGLGDCRCPLGCSTGIEALSHACSARCFGCQARSSGPPARTGALPPRGGRVGPHQCGGGARGGCADIFACSVGWLVLEVGCSCRFGPMEPRRSQIGWQNDEEATARRG